MTKKLLTLTMVAMTAAANGKETVTGKMTREAVESVNFVDLATQEVKHAYKRATKNSHPKRTTAEKAVNSVTQLDVLKNQARINANKVAGFVKANPGSVQGAALAAGLTGLAGTVGYTMKKANDYMNPVVAETPAVVEVKAPMTRLEKAKALANQGFEKAQTLKNNGIAQVTAFDAQHPYAKYVAAGVAGTAALAGTAYKFFGGKTTSKTVAPTTSKKDASTTYSFFGSKKAAPVASVVAKPTLISLIGKNGSNVKALASDLKAHGMTTISAEQLLEQGYTCRDVKTIIANLA